MPRALSKSALARTGASPHFEQGDVMLPLFAATPIRPLRARRLLRLVAGAAILVITLLLPGIARATIRYVAQDATGAGNGTSWADAFLHPQDAMNVSGRGDQIWVKEARYVRKRGAPQVLAMRNGVPVYGGFAGDESVLGHRDPVLHETILDGEQVVDHVVITPGGGRLDGFTVTGGGSPGVFITPGGGFLGDGATLARLVFLDNRASYGGGAHGSDLVVEDSRFEDNVASVWGGALVVTGDSFVRRSTFSNNVATEWPATFHTGAGGAIAVDRGTVEIEDCTFASNLSAFGGAIMATAGPSSPVLRVRRSHFSDNRARVGGAIDVGEFVGEATIEDSTFERNAAPGLAGDVCDPVCHWLAIEGRGGAIAAESEITLRRATFSANTAQPYGGGLSVRSSSAVIEDARFEDNSAVHGGAIHFDRAPHFVRDGVFLRNQAITGGGGAVALYPTEPSFSPTGGTFERCRFEENVGSVGGGALALFDGQNVVESSRFFGNQALLGGAVVASSVTPGIDARIEMRNSVVAFNQASDGGGLALNRITAQIENDTFYGNTALRSGGGLWLDTRADVTVRNTILWNDTAPFRPEIEPGSMVTFSVEYSDVQGGWPGTGNLNVDPGLRDPSLRDFHLTWPGSKLLIDAGTPGFSPVYDFDGELRPIDGDLDGNARVDIGADELADPCAGQGDSDFDGRCDPMDNCPYAANPGQQDSGGLGLGDVPDGIGDACQCGDVSGDGRVTIADTVMILRALLVPPRGTLVKPELCDVGGSTGCSVADGVITRRALLVPPTASVQQVCAPALP